MRRMQLGLCGAFGIGLAGLLIGGNNASAAVITITNSSFESPAQSFDAYAGNTYPDQNFIPAWTSGAVRGSGDYGVQNDDGHVLFSSVPDGHQFSYINTTPADSYTSSSNTLTSDSVGAIVGSTTYTLTVDVGNRFDNLAAGGTYTISLLDGGTPLATQTYSGSSITAGTWYALPLTFTTPSVVDALNLQVQLGFSDTVDAFGQGEFDSVTLSADPVPEPTGLAVLALGGGALLIRRRKPLPH